jgi:hypothetical protein
MTPSSWAARLDDLLNPIVVKELRQAVQSKIVIAALSLYLVLQVGILGAILILGEMHDADLGDLNAGREIFLVLQGILLGTCMVLIPTYAGIRLSAERSDTNVDLLFISTLRPAAIIWGKFQAAVVLMLLIFSACAPFMTFTYLLRGIDMPTILFVLALDFVAVLVGTQLALFLGSAPAHLGVKILLGLFGVWCLCVLFGFTLAGSAGVVETGWWISMETKAFWLTTAAVILLVLVAVGLFFCWSVAIVSPPAANRMLPVRAFLVVCWLVTAAAYLLLADELRQPNLVYTWMEWSVVVFCVQLVIAINERDRWGLRVARSIPRRRLLRVPAFLFYSGSAGGLLFAVLFLGLTIGLTAAFYEYRRVVSPTATATDLDNRPWTILALFALYVFDYCLTALFLRNTVVSKQLPPLFTWLLALVLGALGCMLPYVILFVFFNDQLRHDDVSPWALITNPFITIYNFAQVWAMRPGSASVADRSFATGCVVFASTWAVVVTLLCLPWAIRQMRRFHPPVRAEDPSKVLSQGG